MANGGPELTSAVAVAFKTPVEFRTWTPGVNHVTTSTQIVTLFVPLPVTISTVGSGTVYSSSRSLSSSNSFAFASSLSPSTISTPSSSLSSSTSYSTFVPPSDPPSTLSRSVQIGLEIGIPFGALTFMGLGGLLVFYFLRLRQCNLTIPVDTIGDNDYGIEVDPGFEDSRRPELEDTDTRIELDGEHWRRELPATRRSSKSISQNAKSITTDSGRSRRDLPAIL